MRAVGHRCTRRRGTGRARAAIIAGLTTLTVYISPGTGYSQQLDNYLPTNLAGFDVTPGVTVASRLRPAYEPLSIRFGDIFIRPALSQSVGYDDNVLGTVNKRGSATAATQGSLQAERTAARSELKLDLDFYHINYLDLPAQSYTNWDAGAGWSHEIGRDTIGVGFQHFSLNQLPVGIDSAGLTKPLSYQVDTARLSYRATRGSWTFVPVADFAATRFGDGGAANGLNQTKSLDRNVETFSLTTFYAFAPQRSAVVVVRGTTAQYITGSPRADYKDGAVLAGFDYAATGLIRLRALVGYEIRSYDNALFENHSAPVAEATVIWTPSGLTTFSATLLRRIEDSNEAIRTGYTYTQGKLRVDHEYLRNVLLQGHASIQSADYLQVGDQQTIYEIGASITYLINRNVRMSLGYDFATSHQKSTQATLSGDYNRNIVLLQMRIAI